MDGLRMLENLHRAEQLGAGIFAERIGTLKITRSQAVLLGRLSRDEGCSQTDLVDATGIDRSTLADVVRRMVGKGWLQRRRTKQDARVYAVQLTPAGRLVLNQVRNVDKALAKNLRAQISGIDLIKIAVPVSEAAE